MTQNIILFLTILISIPHAIIASEGNITENKSSLFSNSSESDTSSIDEDTTSSPQLQCYATLSPDPHKIIYCPPDRNKFCIKEVAFMDRRDECGFSDAHPFDKWDIQSAQCVYRKCANECPTPNEPVDPRQYLYLEEDQMPPNKTIYFYEKTAYGTQAQIEKSQEKKFKREIYCCEGNICNSGYSLRNVRRFLIYSIMSSTLCFVLLTL